MTRRFLLVMAVAYVLGGTVRADVKKELGMLQGTWVIESATMDGKPYEPFLKTKYVVTDNRFIHMLSDGKVHATFEVKPDQDPRTVDVWYTEGPDKGKVRHGIYAWQGESIKVCLGALDSKDRPTEFNCKGGRVCFVARKEKP